MLELLPDRVYRVNELAYWLDRTPQAIYQRIYARKVPEPVQQAPGKQYRLSRKDILWHLRNISRPGRPRKKSRSTNTGLDT